jgi:predicted DNA-binding protein
MMIWREIMNKTERLQIRITPELKQQLQRLAEADGRTISNYVEQLIRAAVEQKQ